MKHDIYGCPFMHSFQKCQLEEEEKEKKKKEEEKGRKRMSNSEEGKKKVRRGGEEGRKKKETFICLYPCTSPLPSEVFICMIIFIHFKSTIQRTCC